MWLAPAPCAPTLPEASGSFFVLYNLYFNLKLSAIIAIDTEFSGLYLRLPCVKGAPPQAVRDCITLNFFYNPSDSLREPPPLAQWRLNGVCI